MAEAASDLAVHVTHEAVRALEARARRGWPALETARQDGWELGASGRYTRRANCVAPESDGRERLEEKIERAEAWYAARGLAPVFKLTAASRPAGLDAALAARGYGLHDETVTMELGLETFFAVGGAPSDRGASGDVGADRVIEVVANRLDDRWWRASCSGSAVRPERQADYQALLAHAIASSDASLFASAAVDGTTVSVALGNVRDADVHLVQVATLPEARGRRHAEAVLRAILFAARDHDAGRALLSVEAANEGARRLYARLGFVERYRYAYRERTSGESRSATGLSR